MPKSRCMYRFFGLLEIVWEISSAPIPNKLWTAVRQHLCKKALSVPKRIQTPLSVPTAVSFVPDYWLSGLNDLIFASTPIRNRKRWGRSSRLNSCSSIKSGRSSTILGKTECFDEVDSKIKKDRQRPIGQKLTGSIRWSFINSSHSNPGAMNSNPIRIQEKFGSRHKVWLACHSPPTFWSAKLILQGWRLERKAGKGTLRHKMECPISGAASKRLYPPNFVPTSPNFERLSQKFEDEFILR